MLRMFSLPSRFFLRSGSLNVSNLPWFSFPPLFSFSNLLLYLLCSLPFTRIQLSIASSLQVRDVNWTKGISGFFSTFLTDWQISTCALLIHSKVAFAKNLISQWVSHVIYNNVTYVTTKEQNMLRFLKIQCCLLQRETHARNFHFRFYSKVFIMEMPR